MHGAFEVDGVHTEVLVTDYGTRVLVLVTQIGKLGTMFLARGASAGPAGASAGLDPPDVRVLVGRHDDEMLEAAARRIAHVLKSRGIDKEVLVSLGLPPKGLEVASLRGLVRCASEFASRRSARDVFGGVVRFACRYRLKMVLPSLFCLVDLVFVSLLYYTEQPFSRAH